MLKRFPHDPESDEHLEARETYLPEAGVSSSLLFAPFGQAVHLQRTHPGKFFGGKYDFIDMLRSQILSLLEPIYS